ncbi:MAG: tail fiber domain-containing protein [Bacteroidia bacterium]
MDIQSGAFVIEGNGKVGIGTNTPESLLHVKSTSTGSSTGIEVSSGGYNYLIYGENGDLHLRKASETNQLVLDVNGRIGIGTDNPTQAKVVINGSVSSSLSYGWLNSSGNTGGAGSPNTNPYSLYANERIAASEFNAHSDMRIKNIQGTSNANEDLATLMQIQVTDYTLRDTIAKGKTPQKKVIAQQVADVYPQAVSKNLTEVIPDIYQRAEVKDGWIMLATDLKPGERVKIITENGSDIYEVSMVENNRFQVAESETGTMETETVFVYGREVNDFHTVDYEALSMLNVSATQEQQRVIEAQKSEIEALTTRLEQAETKNMELQSDFEARLKTIESLLQSGAFAPVSHNQNRN